MAPVTVRFDNPHAFVPICAATPRHDSVTVRLADWLDDESILMKSVRAEWVWPVLLGIAGLAVVLFGYVPAKDANVLFAVVQVVLSVLIAGLGSVIVARQPGNRIAWLLYATALGLFLAVATSLIVEFGDVPVSPTVWHYTVSWVFNVVATVALFPVLMILFVFPTGRFLTRRWRWAGWLAGVFTVAMSLVVLFSEEVGHIYDPDNEHWNLSNPIGFLQPEVAEFMNLQSVGLMMVLAVGGVVSMIVRYRRSDSLVRTQIKWVVYASAVAAVALQGISFSGGDPTLYVLSVLIPLAVIPIAITIAISRYKLFEIDRLISRTVSYTLVVVALGAVFAILTWLPSLLVGGINQDGTTGSTPPVIVAASTLVVAALFNPLRKRIQRRVDRRFNRSSYQAEAIGEGFSDKLQESLTVDEIAEAWSRTVEEALQPEATGIWINRNSTTHHTQDSGRP